jgi:hypothetical protein
VPGRTLTQESYNTYQETEVTIDPDGIPNSGDEYIDSQGNYEIVPEFDYNTGSRFSITVGFNLTK